MMKDFLYLLILLLIVISGCANEQDQTPEFAPDPNAIAIMPLGASRVEGARPTYESYRYELWRLMINSGWNIDYIGTREDDAAYPAVNGQGFDNDHEGRGGWTSSELLSGINQWLEDTGNPDIVLLSSPGGNDALTGQSFDQAVENINEIIDIIQAANTNVTVIIEQMAPGTDELMAEGNLASFISQMNQEVLTMAEEQSTVNSQVLVVDMFTDFKQSMLADDVHYNEAGALFIAQRYFEVLSQVMTD